MYTRKTQNRHICRACNRLQKFRDINRKCATATAPSLTRRILFTSEFLLSSPHNTHTNKRTQHTTTRKHSHRVPRPSTRRHRSVSRRAVPATGWRTVYNIIYFGECVVVRAHTRIRLQLRTVYLQKRV